MNKMIYFALTAAVAVASLLLVSCNDKIDVNREYDFALSCWHLPSEIVPGERVEIRFTLTRQGDFKGAEYYIGYIQLEGKGEVSDSEGTLLVNRELHELRAMPGLDVYKRQGGRGCAGTVRSTSDAARAARNCGSLQTGARCCSFRETLTGG